MKKFLKIIAPLLATLLLVTACSSKNTSNNSAGESSEKQKVFTSNTLCIIMNTVKKGAIK